MCLCPTLVRHRCARLVDMSVLLIFLERENHSKWITFFLFFWLSLNSVWDECGRSSLDGAKRSEAEGWFPQCHLSMFCNAAFCSFVLHCPGYLYSCSCLAEEKRDEEKLVSEQEAIPQEKPRRRRKRRLPPAMRVHALLLKFSIMWNTCFGSYLIMLCFLTSGLMFIVLTSFGLILDALFPDSDHQFCLSFHLRCESLVSTFSHLVWWKDGTA